MQHALGQMQISGPDAAQFLQGQLTCNILQLCENQPQLFAYCNRQGRVIASGRVTLVDGCYWLSLPSSMLQICLQHFKHYALFAKIEFTLPQQVSPSLNEDWPECDIRAGIASIYPSTTEKFLPHDLNYQLTGALDFHKGCYLGQEIIARMQYKAKLKYHCYFFTAKVDIVPQPGTAICDENHRLLGHIADSHRIDVFDIIGLAVLPLDSPPVLQVNLQQQQVELSLTQMRKQYHITN